jgi:hypothetical protein
MKKIRKRLTYANVMSSIAVFLMLGGATAIAAKKISSNQIKSGAVKTGKLAKEAVATAKIKNAAVNTAKLRNAAVSTDKLADNAVTTPKIANGAVGTDKLANGAVSNAKLGDGSVTTNKLEESERSQAFLTEITGVSSTELDTGLLGNYATATSAISGSVPAGNYVVTAKSEFFNSSIEARTVICRLLDDGVTIDEGSTPLGEGILTPQGMITTVAISNGGELNLRCRAGGDAVFPSQRKIVAMRVATVG